MAEYRTKWERVFKNGPSKISGRQVLEDFSFLNSLSQMKICKLVFFQRWFLVLVRSSTCKLAWVILMFNFNDSKLTIHLTPMKVNYCL